MYIDDIKLEKIKISLKEFLQQLESSKKQTLTELPEKWCIERDLTNYKIINDYLDAGLTDSQGIVFVKNKNKFISTSFDFKDIEKYGYVEITFEDFKRLVLDKTDKKMEEKQTSDYETLQRELNELKKENDTLKKQIENSKSTEFINHLKAELKNIISDYNRNVIVTLIF
jgi:hypothetical protein